MNEREVRKTINSKQDVIAEFQHYPGKKDVPEGQFLVAHPRGKAVRLYKKLKGILWWMNFTKDGNYEIEKNLKVNNNLDIGRLRQEKQQPSFLAFNSAIDTNIAINTVVTVDFDTEVFDIGSNFATDTFTAPVTGKYFLSTTIGLLTMDSAADYYYVKIVTSNREYLSMMDTAHLASDTSANYPNSFSFSCVADMEKGDTAHVIVYQGNGTQQTDIYGNATLLGTFFSGYLLG